MLYFWILSMPAVLATARRTGPTALTVKKADAGGEITNQKVLATVRTASNTEVCFQVQKSYTYWSVVEASNAILQNGDNECAQVQNQDESNQFALKSLSVGDLVRLQLSHVPVTHMAERHGLQVKETTLKRSVTVLKVGSEIARKVQTIQRVSANYVGPTKPEGANVVVAAGVDSSVGELACFRVKSEMTYINLVASDDTNEKLNTGEHFCIHFDSKDDATLKTIRTFDMEQLVTIVLASQMVEFQWKTGADAIETGAEWDFQFDVKKGLQNSAEISTEHATVTFDHAEAVSTAEGNYAMRFCFKKNGTDNADERVCFLNIVQTVSAQTRLVGLTVGDRRHLNWRKCTVSYSDEQTTGFEENIISSIVSIE